MKRDKGVERLSTGRLECISVVQLLPALFLYLIEFKEVSMQASVS